MHKRLHFIIQTAACVAIGSAGVLVFSPSAHAAPPPCNNEVCTLDLNTLDLYCSAETGQNCNLCGGGNDTSCQPSSCNPQ